MSIEGNSPFDYVSVPPKVVKTYNVAIWQPIETAPQDGRTKLILGAWSRDHEQSTVCVGALELPDSKQGDQTKARHLWGLGAIFYPTHWMPLPPAPTAGQE